MQLEEIIQTSFQFLTEWKLLLPNNRAIKNFKKKNIIIAAY